MVTTIIYFFVMSRMFKIDSRFDNSGYIEKENIKNALIIAINNDADLDLIKHAFNNISRKSSSFGVRIDSKQYYESNVVLTRVLKDIKVDMYMGDKIDTTFISKLDKMIEVNEEVNPFEGLEQSQKEYFANVRAKLGDNYDRVSTDFIRISDELVKKNELVEKYLRDSRLSFWVSISGLFFSLVVGIIQIFRWRNNSKPRNETDDNF